MMTQPLLSAVMMMMDSVESSVSSNYLLRLFCGTEVLDLQVVLLTVALAKLILLQLSLQIQLFFPDERST